MTERLLVVDKRIENIPEGTDYILNISPYFIDDDRVLDYSKEFRLSIEETKKRYLDFLYSFSHKSGFLDRNIYSGVSLWWFSEIQHKDNFFDPLLKNLSVIDLVQLIVKEKMITAVDYYSDNEFFKEYSGKESIKTGLITLKFFIKRTVEFIKILYLKTVIKSNHLTGKIEFLFFSFFPGNWNMHNSILSDRFFRDIPYSIKDAGFALFIERSGRNTIREVPSGSIVVQSNVGLWFLLKQYFKVGHYFWFMINRKKMQDLCRYNDVNIWSVFRKYIIQTVLFNDFLFSTLIAGLKNIIDEFSPKKIVAPGEFGLNAKAVAVACSGTETESVWYQHASFSEDKFWFYNHPDEVLDSGSGVKKNMPLPDMMLTWSDNSIDFLERHSHFLRDRCRVVESVKYSGFKNHILFQNKQHIEGKYLFAPTVEKQEIRQFCFFISRLCGEGILKQEQVILKLHPAADGFFDVERLLLEYDNIRNIEVSRGLSGLESFLGRIKCVIAGGTTLGLEAAFFGLPVTQYIPKYGLRFSPLDESTATCFSDVETLKEILAHPDKLKPIDYRTFFLEPSNENRRFIDAIIN